MIGCAIAIGARASSVLEEASKRMPGMATADLGALDSMRSAEELLERIKALATGLPGCARVLLLVDGYSDRGVRAARLFLGAWRPRGAVIVMIPPMPYEKRLEDHYRFNVGVMAGCIGGEEALVRVDLDLGEDGHSEEDAMAAVAAAVADLALRAGRPPLSEMLGEGGSYLLAVGGPAGAKEMALASALEGSPAMVVASGSASELVKATSLARALGVGVDAAPGGVSYLLMRKDDLRLEDPIYAALGGRGDVPTLDPGPSSPFRVDLPLDLYEMRRAPNG